MTNSIYDKTEQYFEKLWEVERKKWRIGDVPVVEMNNGTIAPVEYCLSTIARVREQENNPLSNIEKIITSFKPMAINQFFYPSGSIHVSLQGCTQRLSLEDYNKQIDSLRKNKIKKLCSELLSKIGPIDMTLKGINIQGSKIFIQVFSHNNLWEELRCTFSDKLIKNGENPITYPDKFPIHMNIMIVKNKNQSQLCNIIDFIEDKKLRSQELGLLRITCIELLTTDFVVSNPNTQVIEKFYLKARG